MDPQDKTSTHVHKGFWRRLSTWLKPWKRQVGNELTEALLREGGDGGLAGRSAANPDLALPRRRMSQSTRLEDGYDKLIGLMDTLDQHMQQQADRSEQLVTQTRRMAEAMAQSQGLQKQRTEAVEELAGQFRNQTRQMQQVAEAVEVLPRAIKQQADQLGQIRDQLEAQLEAQLSTAHGVKQLAGSADVMRGLADEQRRQFAQLAESQHAASVQLAGALDRQSARFTWLVACSLGVAIVTAAGAVVAVLLAIGRMHGK